MNQHFGYHYHPAFGRIDLDAPYALPKLRSRAIREACADMPCTLKLTGFLGEQCNLEPGAVVACHIGKIGRGVNTKTSDLGVVAGCSVCHDILDGRRPGFGQVLELYPRALLDQVIRAQQHTLTLLALSGHIEVKGGEWVR